MPIGCTSADADENIFCFFALTPSQENLEKNFYINNDQNFVLYKLIPKYMKNFINSILEIFMKIKKANINFFYFFDHYFNEFASVREHWTDNALIDLTRLISCKSLRLSDATHFFIYVSKRCELKTRSKNKKSFHRRRRVKFKI